MVKWIEFGAKIESKGIVFVAFQQNNPPAIKPCMSRELVIFPITRRLSLTEY
jgi:hypothetical protein